MDDEKPNKDFISATLVEMAVSMTAGRGKTKNIRPESSLAAAGLEVKDIEELKGEIGRRFMVFIPDSEIKTANTFKEIGDFVSNMIQPDSE